jgi:hypothetical protein
MVAITVTRSATRSRNGATDTSDTVGGTSSIVRGNDWVTAPAVSMTSYTPSGTGEPSAAVPVAVSRTLLAFSAGAKIVSPNGDGRRDVVTFRFLLAQPADATLELATPEASFPLLLAQLGTGRQTFAFTGTAADGSPVPDGVYEVRLTAGAVTQSLPLTIDNLPPTVSLVSVAPLQLRVAEHVTVIATINGRVVRASVQPGVVRLAKGQVVRTLRAVVRDAAGNESKPVTYRMK